MNEEEKLDLGTVATSIQSLDEYRDPNVVKVVLGQAGHALYFSRSPIPWAKEPYTIPKSALWHLGIYAFRVSSLKRFVKLPRAEVEIGESLEQLRALANDMAIKVLVIEERPPRGVDTEADLQQVRSILKN